MMTTHHTQTASITACQPLRTTGSFLWAHEPSMSTHEPLLTMLSWSCAADQPVSEVAVGEQLAMKKSQPALNDSGHGWLPHAGVNMSQEIMYRS